MNFLISLGFMLSQFGPWGHPAQEPKAGQPIALPTIYREDRFFVAPVTTKGEKLEFFTDSAGGLFINEEAAERLKLTVTPERKTNLPALCPDFAIPSPGPLELRKVPPEHQSLRDGMLGMPWFAGRVWTFDYPGRQLWWRAAKDVPQRAHRVELGFLVDKGERKANFARIPARIDGEILDFLLDTGASNVLSPKALSVLGDGREAERATSFIVRSRFERWHGRHPEWRCINEPTRTGQAMIEVPALQVGGYTVGPVWFSVQQDYAFHTYMAKWMDRPTEGALGGSALHFFRLTVDWPEAKAYFELPDG